MVIEIRGEDNNRIRCNGWAIVSRYSSAGWRGIDFHYQSNHLVTVRDGTIRIPDEAVLASLWLYPNELAWGYGFGGLFVSPLAAVQILPFCAVPIPIVAPQEAVRIFPMIPGYCSGVGWPAIFETSDLLGKARAVGAVRVHSIPSQVADWNNLERILRSDLGVYEKIGEHMIYLEPRDLAFARAIIIAELRHLMFQKRPATTSQPMEQSERSTRPMIVE